MLEIISKGAFSPENVSNLLSNATVLYLESENSKLPPYKHYFDHDDKLVIFSTGKINHKETKSGKLKINSKLVQITHETVLLVI